MFVAHWHLLGAVKPCQLSRYCVEAPHVPHVRCALCFTSEVLHIPSEVFTERCCASAAQSSVKTYPNVILGVVDAPSRFNHVPGIVGDPFFFVRGKFTKNFLAGVEDSISNVRPYSVGVVAVDRLREVQALDFLDKGLTYCSIAELLHIILLSSSLGLLLHA